MINPKTKGIIIQGRSDGVLNPSGVRFGSGEIYTVLDQFSSVIDDSICVGQRRPQDLDERVLLFVKMREGTKSDKGLDEAIRRAPSVQIYLSCVDYIVTLYRLRRPSGRPPDYTTYTRHKGRRTNI